MKGTVLKENNRWTVEHWEGFSVKAYPLHPYQTDPVGVLKGGSEIEFELEDFWETGLEETIKVAKIKYPNGIIQTKGKTMTRVKVTYVAIDVDGNKPILSASGFSDLRKALDDYFGVGEKEAECLGFTHYESKYPDEYEGYYEYKYTVRTRNLKTDEFENEEYKDKIKVYCVDFYPHTIYEVDLNKEQLKTK